MGSDNQLDHVGRIHALWRREMPDVDLDGLRILPRMGRIGRIAGEEILAAIKKYGLDSGEYFVLAALRRAAPDYALRPTELFRALMVSSGGLTDRLRRLESQGLVRRRVSDQDRRSILVELTPEGRRRVESAFRDDMEIEKAIVSVLDKAERDQLATLLTKLARAMEDTEQGEPSDQDA